MSDDLANFFAKKAAKKDKKKKGGIVKIEEVGSALERKHRREEVTANRDEAQNENGDVEQPQRKEGEDGEWLDYSDSKALRLTETCGLKDMNLTEQVEEQMKEERKEKAAAAAEPVKTWNIARPEKSEQDENSERASEAPAAPQPAEPKRYRPPGGGGARTGGSSARANIDLTNQDMFPSFAAAEEIEKQKATALKRDERAKGPGSAWSTSTRPQQAQRADTAPAPTTTRNTFRALDTHREVPAPSTVSNAAPKKGSYVPPHLRNK